MANEKGDNLYKVYVQTKDHPHVLEMIVSAATQDQAAGKAFSHVKEANPTKGRLSSSHSITRKSCFQKRRGKMAV